MVAAATAVRLAASLPGDIGVLLQSHLWLRSPDALSSSQGGLSQPQPFRRIGYPML